MIIKQNADCLDFIGEKETIFYYFKDKKLASQFKVFAEMYLLNPIFIKNSVPVSTPQGGIAVNWYEIKHTNIAVRRVKYDWILVNLLDGSSISYPSKTRLKAIYENLPYLAHLFNEGYTLFK